MAIYKREIRLYNAEELLFTVLINTSAAPSDAKRTGLGLRGGE